MPRTAASPISAHRRLKEPLVGGEVAQQQRVVVDVRFGRHDQSGRPDAMRSHHAVPADVGSDVDDAIARTAQFAEDGGLEGLPYAIARPALVFRLARIPLLSGVLAMVDPGAMVKKTLRDAYGDQAKVTPALIDRYRLLSLRQGNRDAFVARVRQPPVDRTGDLARISARTLILWGREDRLIPVEHADRFAKAIPGAKLIVYDGVGHVPMEELGERSAADARDFLAAAR